MRPLFLLVLSLLAPSVALADRPAEMESRAGVVAPGGGAGVARMRVPPEPPSPLTTDELRAALERARPELQACLAAEGLRGGTLRARITRDASLRLTPRSRPRSDAAEACMDTAARRHVTPLLGRWIRRTVSASIRMGRGGTVRPPDPPPPPATTDAREVHDRLSASEGSLRRCLDDAYPGMAGTVTLRVVAHRDGSMALEGVSLPTGVPAGPMLVCLQNEVAHLRVTAGGERAVSHDVHLGR